MPRIRNDSPENSLHSRPKPIIRFGLLNHVTTSRKTQQTVKINGLKTYLTETEKNVLAKGPNFTISPQLLPAVDLITAPELALAWMFFSG